MKEARARIKPSQRMKKRYLLFHYTAAKGVTSNAIKELIKRLNMPSLSLVEFDSNSGKGIIFCSRADCSAARKTLNEIGLKTLRTSGSIKKLRHL